MSSHTSATFGGLLESNHAMYRIGRNVTLPCQA